MLWSERLFSSFILLVSLVCLYASTKLNIFHRGGEIGPGFLPLALSSLLAILSVIYLLRTLIHPKMAKRVKSTLIKKNVKSNIWFLVILIICLSMTPVFGMLVSLGVFSFVILSTIEKVVWYRSAIFSCLLLSGIHIIFSVFLEMKIPIGILFG